ncbi:phage holin family protein [Candidatus Peregrinibacteria bacterium]|nr:phage holin family protein [Candidatus Peregrinibacteria bacterium]
MKLLIKWLVFSIAVYATAYLLSPGIQVADFTTALVTALILGLINAIIKPIIVILTLPINILTLGLLTFVINALLVLLAANIVPGFQVAGFWYALLFSLIVSVINAVLSTLLGAKD